MKITKRQSTQDIGSKPGQNPSKGKTQKEYFSSYRITSKMRLPRPKDQSQQFLPSTKPAPQQDILQARQIVPRSTKIEPSSSLLQIGLSLTSDMCLQPAILNPEISPETLHFARVNRNRSSFILPSFAR